MVFLYSFKRVYPKLKWTVMWCDLSRSQSKQRTDVLVEIIFSFFVFKGLNAKAVFGLVSVKWNSVTCCFFFVVIKLFII
jgi:hypothetical protein